MKSLSVFSCLVHRIVYELLERFRSSCTRSVMSFTICISLDDDVNDEGDNRDDENNVGSITFAEGSDWIGHWGVG